MGSLGNMNQAWSKISRVFGGLLLVVGGTVSLGLLLAIGLSHAAGVLLAVLLTLLVFFGLVPLAIGGLFLYASARARQRAIRDRFFELLRLQQGRLSLLDFAHVTRLEPAIARRYLDGWAREFSAQFEVNDHGEVYYLFTPQRLSGGGGSDWEHRSHG